MVNSGAWASVSEAFTARRAAHPDAVAVTGAYGDLSFEQLGRMADSVAASVRALGTPAERAELPVGYLGARRPHFLATVLGVLGSGAAYVPLDPSWPPARIADVAEVAGLRHVFVDAEHTALARDAGLSPVLPVEEALEPERPAPVARWAGTGSDLAYLVFTSGSTGAPKGVLTEHAALANTCARIADRWGLTPADRVLQFTTLGVDITLEEAFSAWTAGAALALMEPATAGDLVRFTAFLEEFQVSALDLPTSFWTAWLSAVEAGDVPPPPGCVRSVAVGSEEVAADDIARWQAVAGPGCRTFNMYGSTEQAITSVVDGPLAPGDPVGSGVIGRPLSGVRAYVLDERLCPQPPGVPGELYIGGLATARGYVRQSARTAERFLPDPFAGRPGDRMYATGDRAVALTDGGFRFAGRIDTRLKIRGFTVQPREVEGVLAEVAGVEKVSVTTEPGPDGRDLLVAEVVGTAAAGEAERLVGELTRRAAERLPDHACPRRYVVHSQAGSTPRMLGPSARPPGRVDTAEDPPDSGPAHRAAVAGVTAMWRELLGDQEIAASDSFLDLGGNSLLAIQLLTRLRGRYGVAVDIARFFEEPTVAALASVLVAAGVETLESWRDDASGSSRLPRTTRDEGPCWSGQERLWFLQRLLPESAAYHIPLAFEVTGEVSLPALRIALQAVAERHEPLRTAVRLDGARLTQVVVAPDVPVETASVPHTVQEELDSENGVLASFVSRPFDLEAGRVLRAMVVECAAGRTLLAFAVHHVAFDEWSAGLFLNELSEAYAFALRDAPSAPRPLGARYLDFCVWQADAAFRQRVTERLGFWREYLEGLPEQALPADLLPPERPTRAGDERRFTVPRRQAAALAALTRREGVTRYHTLLALFSVLLARYSGTYDLAVGVPAANRGSEELEELIGFFVNTLPVRVRLEDNPTFAEAVRRVSKSTLAAQDAGHVPVDEIARAVGRHGSANRNPVFQTLFVMDEEQRGSLRLSGSEVRPVHVPVRSSALDLTLAIGDGDDGTLSGRLWYCAEVFGPETAERMVASFLTLVDQVVADPDLRVRDMDAARPVDRSLAAATAPALGPEERAPLAVRFETAARRWPDRTALVSDGRSVAYGALSVLVEDVRTRLLDAAPMAAFVPLVLPEGPLLIAAMLAVNSLGRAFLPVDPRWSRQHVADVVARTGNPFAVVAEGADTSAVPAGVRPLPVGDRPRPGPREPHRTADAPGHERRPVYAVCTAEPADPPDLAVVGHWAFARHTEWAVRYFGTAAPTVLHATPPARAHGVWELLWPLAHGGTAVLPDSGERTDPKALTATLARDGVDTLFLLPSALAELVDHVSAEPGRADDLAALRTLITIGEAPREPAARRFGSLAPAARLYHLHTDAGGGLAALVRAMTGTPEESGELVVGDGSAVIVDDRRRAVPHGVLGELCLTADDDGYGTGGVANTALGRRRLVKSRYPELTAGAHLVRTGELARMRPSGAIELCGAVDDRAMLRGVRVWLGRVAAHVAGHPGVRSATVAATPPDAAPPQRTAALLDAAPPDVATAALRAVTGANGLPTTPQTGR
ncbi:non-ribosomal peptide synthetase [Streptomyces koyangensis]|uniref:Amino acid adenylation domain-containing protein n=1 Tax=Streptomyces koyangensis TaxID=188770 RepID=A0A385DJ44_9ACTN|nr:non-ribosomal peptide synthetase [Streptomyces koyangensis]AXQ58523.1 amino acid adenylation domain-containing protein [Streptomyces koyangensis]